MTEKHQCELCLKEVDEDQLSDYYRDITACLTCVPVGFRDLECERLTEEAENE